MDAAKEFANR